MARYFFNLSDGTRERDTVGTEFDDEAAAQREAIRFAGEVMRHEPHRLEEGRMQVDVSGTETTVFTIEIRLRRGDVD